MTKPVSIIVLVAGIALTIFGFTLATAGAAASWLATSPRDDGFFTAPTERFTVSSHALVSAQLDAVGEGTPERLPLDVGTVRLRATAAGNNPNIFIGIAPQDRVEQFLAGVHHTELRDVRFSPFRPGYRDIPGTSTPAPPDTQNFWAASASGPGDQELTWKIVAGNWTVVVMNADGTAGVSANLQAGFRSDLIRPAATGLLVTGGAALLIGLPLLVAGAVALGRHGSGPGSGTTQPVPSSGQPVEAFNSADAGYYPVHLVGRLDPSLTRWLWLVKWVLAIPHLFVLFFLWFAFSITSIIAWFAILVTGRYPQPLFHFNVGVLRWSWRVSFYALGAAGTDRYPPFTLAHADYPADLDVDYPQRLSRGLVLVKSWLLLVPHLIIVAAFTGTATWTWQMQENPGGTVTTNSGLSLVGLFVLIALVTLLFTGRYPRPLFDLIIGLNRWIYRVIGYGALMTDTYPPFRLDQGGGEPVTKLPPPPPVNGRLD